jgi:protein phosphatase
MTAETREQRIEAFGLTDPGCVRTNNEDCFLIAPEIGLYIVADGMGGAQAGEHASRMAAEFVRDKMRSAARRDEATLVEAIEQANTAVMAAAARNPHLEGMGTTVVVALAVDGSSALEGSPEKQRFLIASVGDSRAYLCDDTQVREITEDQTWVNEIGRRLGMDDSVLKAHPMRHVLTMAVGVSQPIRVNRYYCDLKPGMQLLLSSDGLHGVVAPSILAEAMMNPARTLESKCRYLIDAARAAGGPDNITTLIVKAE